MTTIQEFDLHIYPQKLWIAVNCPKEVLKDLFPDVEWEDMTISYAETWPVTRYNPDTKGGELIRFNTIEDVNFQNVTHESFHAAADVFTYIDAEIDKDNQEPFAYLVGYIAKCCEEVKDMMNNEEI